MYPNLTVVITPQGFCSTGNRATAVCEMSGVSTLLMWAQWSRFDESKRVWAYLVIAINFAMRNELIHVVVELISRNFAVEG